MSARKKKPGREVDAKGRSTSGGNFVALRHYLLDSLAWGALSAPERAVYVQLARIYNGSNNGRLGLGQRMAAKTCNIARETAAKCLERLMALGFIECTTPGGFSRKTRHQTEWRLTAERCDVTGEVPSKAFMRWRPGGSEKNSRAQNRATTGLNEGQSPALKGSTGREPGPSSAIRAA